MTRKLTMMVAALALALGTRAATETVGDYIWRYRINGGGAELYGEWSDYTVEYREEYGGYPELQGQGMHGGGAAYIAYRKFGAIMGQGVGLQGQSYGIPTMQGGVETIRPYVDEFIAFAKEHQDLTFLVTRIGCGIAGFTDDDISPLFEKAHDVENIVLPPNW